MVKYSSLERSKTTLTYDKRSSNYNFMQVFFFRCYAVNLSTNLILTKKIQIG